MRNVIKYGYNLRSLQNFYIFVLLHEKAYHFPAHFSLNVISFLRVAK